MGWGILEDTVDAVGDAAEAGGEWVADTAEDAADAVGDAVDAAVDAVGDAAEAIGDAVDGAADRLGDAASEAVDALESFRTASATFVALDTSGCYRSWAYPRSLYLIAVARHRLGQDAQAREKLERLLALWTRADPGLTLFKDAKALLRTVKAAERSAGSAPGPAR